MTAWILDPSDPTVAFLGSGTDDVFGAAVGAVTLKNVHRSDKCAGQHCSIHNPSDHHMRNWPIHWRADRGMAERICPCPHPEGYHQVAGQEYCGHGVGHPDPDGIADKTHGCDGCCMPPARRNEVDAEPA